MNRGSRLNVRQQLQPKQPKLDYMPDDDKSRNEPLLWTLLLMTEVEHVQMRGVPPV